MARTKPETPKYERPALVTPLANVGGYKGANFIAVNTTLPNDPKLVDRSKLPNGHKAAEYAELFSRLPKELDAVLKSKGHAEVSITIDERGNVVPVDSGSRNAPHATYISAMIRRKADGTNQLVGIWGGLAGGGNNGAPAAMVTSKLMSTKNGKAALSHTPILDAASVDWGNTRLANSGSLNRNPSAWQFSDGSPTTFIPYHQNQTHGVHKQSALGEHHSRTDTWGCLTGSEESFRARLNSRIAIMMGPDATQKHDTGNGLGLQNSPRVAAKVFTNNRALAANTLGKIYHLNPLMFDTGNTRYSGLAQQLNVPIARHMAPAIAAGLQPIARYEPTVNNAPSKWNIGGLPHQAAPIPPMDVRHIPNDRTPPKRWTIGT